MKIFKDPELHEEITSLDLGILTAGEKKQYTFYVFNETSAVLDSMRFSVTHKEVDIVEAPNKLGAKEKGRLILEWRPSVTLKQGLKTILKFTGNELWT